MIHQLQERKWQLSSVFLSFLIPFSLALFCTLYISVSQHHTLKQLIRENGRQLQNCESNTEKIRHDLHVKVGGKEEELKQMVNGVRITLFFNKRYIKLTTGGRAEHLHGWISRTFPTRKCVKTNTIIINLRLHSVF